MVINLVATKKTSLFIRFFFGCDCCRGVLYGWMKEKKTRQREKVLVLAPLDSKRIM